MDTVVQVCPGQSLSAELGPAGSLSAAGTGVARAGQARSGQARASSQWTGGQAGRRQPGGGQPHCRVAPTALALLGSARRGLEDAAGETGAGARYVAAHLAALRAAAAVVAARPAAGSARRRKAPRSVWELLPGVEPALAEWAAFFAAGAGKRAAAEAGLSRAVSAREADDLLRDAGTFLSLAEDALGAPVQARLPLCGVG